MTYTRHPARARVTASFVLALVSGAAAAGSAQPRAATVPRAECVAADTPAFTAAGERLRLVMLRVFAVAVSSILLAASLATAQTLPVPDIPFQKFVLENGLTLIVHEDHKAPVVAVFVSYHVGSKDERPGRTGLAHLFEHLMNQGSEHANEDHGPVVTRLGGTDVNATTDEDRTWYYQTVPVAAFDTVLWLEADRMGHLLGAIDQATLDEQRGVVQNEKRQRENLPYGRAYDALQAAMYPKEHPYAWSTIGSMEDLNAASLGDVKAWFTTYYGPSNAVLVVAGDVDTRDVRARVGRYFGAIPPGPPLTRHAAWVAPLSSPVTLVMQDRVPHPRVYTAWNTATWGTPDDAYLALAARILSSGRDSRLEGRLVFRDRLATALTVQLYSMELSSGLYVEATVAPGRDVKAVRAALEEEMASFRRDGPTPAELQRAKADVMAAVLRESERVGGTTGKAGLLAVGETMQGDPGAYLARLTLMRDATPGDVQAAVRRWLAEGTCVLEVRPFALNASAAPSATAGTRPEPAAATTGRLPRFERRRLPSGLDLIVARRPGAPLVEVRLLVDAGLSSDGSGQSGLADLTVRLLREGTATRSGSQIADDLRRLGAELDTATSLDTSYVNLSVPRATLDAALDVFADVVLAPAFPPSEYDRVRQERLAAIDAERAQPFLIGRRALPRLLYGDGHPYGQPLTGSGTAAALARLTRDEAVGWHRTWFRPNGATLILVGGLTLEEAVARVGPRLAAWTGVAAHPRAIASVDAARAPGIYVVDRPGAPQSMIYAAQPLPPHTTPQATALEMMLATLGGGRTSRLFLNLREDKHWAYSARSWIFEAVGAQPWFVAASVQTDRTTESVREILAELRGISGDRPPTDAEVRQARDILTLQLAGRWETARAVSGAIAEVARFGLPDDHYDTFAGKVRATTVAEVAAAGRLIDPTRLVWVIAGDRAVIEPGLRALGLGEIRIIDADGHPSPAGPPSAGTARD